MDWTKICLALGALEIYGLLCYFLGIFVGVNLNEPDEKPCHCGDSHPEMPQGDQGISDTVEIRGPD